MPDLKTSTKPVVLIAGPTASGKSSMAMDVAEEFDGQIINADSMQVYKELRIVTARPSEADEARLPHKMYGMISVAQSWSVGQWQAMAVEEIAACHAAGKLPVVTGGTGLYFKALMEGLADIPVADPEIRQNLTARLDKEGCEVLHEELKKVDAITAERIFPTDTQRLLRALEIYQSTGRSQSDWIADGNQGVPDDLRFLPLILQPPREQLYEKINQRFGAMVKEGALEEVRALSKLGLDPSLPAMKAVGVRELLAYEAGECSLEQSIAKAQKISRNYAKRQLTWFRNQIPEGKSYFAQYSESLRPEIFAFIRQFVLT